MATLDLGKVVPQRGTDYWTNADKQEIETDVKNDIKDIDNLTNYYTKSEIDEDMPTKLSDLTDDLGSNPTHTHSQYLTSHQDISGKQNITDNTLTTNNKTVPTAINEVNSIAKGANQALSYSNYQAMITAFNSFGNSAYNVGQNVMIVTLEVPDLWISGIESSSTQYTYTNDSAFTNELEENGYVKVGYYKLSALETQKVDLTNYYNKTQSDSLLNAKENISNKVTSISSSSTDTQYPSAKCVYDIVGDIASTLDTIQGEVI